MSERKAYLVTRSEMDPRVSPVAEILNISTDHVKDGVNFLATEALPSETDILEYPNVGVTKANLSEEEVNRLKESTNILAVEEDVEMHTLEVSSYGIDEEQLVEEGGAGQETYDRGFQEFLQQLYQSFLQGGLQGQSYGEQHEIAGDGGLPRPIPPFQRPIPFPRPPFPPLRQPIPWNISLVRAPGAWARGITGVGIRVAVIDTGITNHNDLLPISGGASFVPGVVNYNDDNGHGTHCAGIIAARNNRFGVVGVAPAARLYAVKVLNSAGSGMSSWIIAGMDWAAREGMHVASMSLGGFSAPMIAYAAAVQRLQDRGTAVVIAAGNSFGSPFPWVNAPANSIVIGQPNASPIAVGAIDRNLNIANFSSRGGQTSLWNQVTVVAPGVGINSTVLGGLYGTKSGTSMATPHVAGAAALMKQRFPGISPASLKLKLMGTARDLGIGGYDQTYGAGLIDCNAATL